ncbi:MAG: chorismate synthase [Eubacteriales bacterium]|nr:chorismate synthase [Eubacteriales bacterium]
MAGSTFGTLFSISTWGESHGKGVGVVVDGCPAGLPLEERDIQIYLNRRRPGQSRFTTPRTESDTVEILSGVFEGRTTGTPIAMMVRNTSQRSGDYSEIASYYRPGHADYTYDCKYGFRDYRGGGRSSGRETIARVAAGAVAARLLEELGITVTAYASAIGPVEIDRSRFDLSVMEQNAVNMPDPEAAAKAMDYLDDCRRRQDSCGGVVECVVHGLPAGVGEPCFEKLSANLAKAIFSIGAVKGFEIGDGFASAKSCGTQNNDPFCLDENGNVTKKTNHAGGMLGGISDGSDLVFRAAFKPTSSISSEQRTVSQTGQEITVSVRGRHDPIIVPRAVVVVECMAALTVLDMLLVSMTSRLDRIKDFFTTAQPAGSDRP